MMIQVLVLFSGFIIEITYGAMYSFGNVTTYLTSYMRLHGFPQLKYTDMMWVQATATAITGIAMPFGGSFEHYWGPRVTVILSAICINTGILLASLSIGHSFGLVLLTYGLFYGAGMSLGYMAPLAAAMRWFPDRRGFASGIIVSGFGLGTFVFNQIETAYVNPDNVAVGEDGYITDEVVLSRVPSLFHLLAGIYFSIQIFFSMFMVNPPKWEPEEADESIPLVGSTEQISHNYTVRQILRHPRFYGLWFTGLFCGLTVFCITAMYKAYGQQYWQNDALLAIIGSLGSAANAAGRIFWGFVTDQLRYRTSMLILTATVTSLLLTLAATPLVGIGLYGLWIVLINATIAGIYSLIPAATAAYFGPLHAAYNYGLVTSYYVISGPLTVIMAETILQWVGWEGFFFVVAFFSALGGIITFFLPEEDPVTRN